MQYKAVVSDFDGTVANNLLDISDIDLETISSLKSQNISFSFATGRPYSGVIRRFCKILDLKAPQITSGGAMIVDPTNDDIIWCSYLPTNIVTNVIEYLIVNNVDFVAENFETMFTKTGKYHPAYGEETRFKKIDSLDIVHTPKISIYYNNHKDADNMIKDVIPTFSKELHITKAHASNGQTAIDITMIDSSKYHALLKLAEILSIPRELIIGIGDGHNDIPLLTACGHKIAMGNAPDELKIIADDIAPLQSLNGFSHILNIITDLNNKKIS